MNNTQSSGFPRLMLWAIGGLMGLTMVLSAASRLSGATPSLIGESPTVASRDLRFEDRSDGSIAVIDATNQSQVEIIPPASNGFLRGTLRGLVRERKRESIGAEIPFTLIGRADGHLLISDAATHRLVDLGAFGHTNAEVFAHLLPPGRHTLAANTDTSRSTP
ncbi:photosynthetic complex assembly protein PuhC [uncultured Nevskia sp.]|uniref:photosynthetic complex assembly protein PuhC n=1 Tax=uncultured Nevskia sp. TaxID=228950 RepID=UPI0025F09862|nr:photosynthetic complex assembly protein PuhC [uncultured Nevskia sp.]